MKKQSGKPMVMKSNHLGEYYKCANCMKSVASNKTMNLRVWQPKTKSYAIFDICIDCKTMFEKDIISQRSFKKFLAVNLKTWQDKKEFKELL